MAATACHVVLALGRAMSSSGGLAVRVVTGSSGDQTDVDGLARSSRVATVLSLMESEGLLRYPRHHHWLLGWVYTSSLLQLVVLKLQLAFTQQLKIRRDELQTPDGGVVSVDWVDVGGVALPHDAPIVVVLPTLCGSAETNRSWIRGIAESSTGFRVAVLNRRGHGGLSLRTPKFNVFGDAEDTRLQLEHVRKVSRVAANSAHI
jgi:predicted alpha/beta-fold hydrolase